MLRGQDGRQWRDSYRLGAATVKEGEIHICALGFEVSDMEKIRFGQIMEQGTYLE